MGLPFWPGGGSPFSQDGRRDSGARTPGAGGVSRRRRGSCAEGRQESQWLGHWSGHRASLAPFSCSHVLCDPSRSLCPSGLPSPAPHVVTTTCICCPNELRSVTCAKEPEGKTQVRTARSPDSLSPSCLGPRSPGFSVLQHTVDALSGSVFRRIGQCQALCPSQGAEQPGQTPVAELALGCGCSAAL